MVQSAADHHLRRCPRNLRHETRTGTIRKLLEYVKRANDVRYNTKRSHSLHDMGPVPYVYVAQRFWQEATAPLMPTTTATLV